MIDSHCHLEFEDFDGDRDEVIKKARHRIKGIVNSSAEIETAKDVLRLHRNNPKFIFPSLGLHPKRAIKASDEELDKFRRTVKEKSGEIVAIGEVGLDYAQVENPKKRQESKEIFRDFLRLSNDLGLPVVVHARRAMDDTLQILKEKEGDVIIHCFAGDLEDMYEAVGRGYYLSFGGIIFRMRKKYERIFQDIPLDNLLLETDAPFLAKRKEDRSEPWFIWDVAERIAEIRGKNFTKVWRKAGENAKDVYDLPIDI